MLVKHRERRRAVSGQFPASSQAVTTPNETSLPNSQFSPNIDLVSSLEWSSPAQLCPGSSGLTERERESYTHTWFGERPGLYRGG